jgi:hypothetical protein
MSAPQEGQNLEFESFAPQKAQYLILNLPPALKAAGDEKKVEKSVS